MVFMTEKRFLGMCEKIKEDIVKMADIAAGLHANVNHKYGEDLPYSYHLSMVSDNVRKYGNCVAESETDIKKLFFGAYFHDTIEDTRTTYSEIKSIANRFFDNRTDIEHAAEIVYSLTNEKGRNREERENEKYFDDMSSVKFAPFLKMCDRMANLKHSQDKMDWKKIGMYRKENMNFISNLLRVGKQEISEQMLRDELNFFPDYV